MSRDTVLIIDDENLTLALMSKFIERMGYNCITSSEPYTALEVIKKEKPEVVITDLIMPGLTGIELLKQVKAFDSDIMVIVMTVAEDIDSAVEAMKAGAVDYLRKPVNYDYIKTILDKCLAQKSLLDENKMLKGELEKKHKFEKIIGRSRQMEKVFATIERVAPTNANVLIHGESGTGKEMIAHAIHSRSKRAEEPFVAVDIVSLPTHLVESELFGYEKGAFTGAQARRDGLLTEADGGTFFMDEITELDYGLQAKLLRVLQERQFRRVGGREVLDMDIRVVAATRRDPLQAVEDGLFREDLYYRLNVLPIELPPLRERKEDIPLLIEYFLEEFRNENQLDIEISVDAVERLQAYHWPGNIRELKNMIERLSIMAKDHKITDEELPKKFSQPGAYIDTSMDWVATLSFKEAKQRWLHTFEIKYVENVLRRFNGNISKAAIASGVNRKTFQRLISKHEIPKKFKLNL